MKKVQSSKHLIFFGAVVALVLAGFAYFNKPLTLWADSPNANVHGYAWTGARIAAAGAADSGFGWISMNCKEGGPGGTNTCGTSVYGVSYDTATGYLSGHAWNGTDTNGDGVADSGLGWISFVASDVSGCPIPDPTHGCQGHIDAGTGAVTGWMRVVSVPKTGVTFTNGGWNGWIRLSDGLLSNPCGGCLHQTPDSGGTKGVTYVALSTQAAKLVGYAWGGTIATPPIEGTSEIGWVNFSPRFGGVTIDLDPSASQSLVLSITDGSTTATSGTNTDILTTTPNSSLTATWSSPQHVDLSSCRASAVPVASQNGVAGWNNTTVLSDLTTPTWSGTTAGVAGPGMTGQIDYTVTCHNDLSNTDETAMVSATSTQAPIDFVFQISSGFSNAAISPTGLITPTDTINASAGAPLLIEWKSLNNSEYDSCTASNAWAGTVSGITAANGYYASDNRPIPAAPAIQSYTINCTNTSTGNTTGPLTLKVLLTIDPSRHNVIMGLSPACVVPTQTFNVSWFDQAGNLQECHPYSPTATQIGAGWLSGLSFTPGNNLLPSGLKALIAPTLAGNGTRFKMACTGTDGLTYPDPQSITPYYQTAPLRIVADAADCANQPGQGKPGRIIWNEH